MMSNNQQAENTLMDIQTFYLATDATSPLLVLHLLHFKILDFLQEGK